MPGRYTRSAFLAASLLGSAACAAPAASVAPDGMTSVTTSDGVQLKADVAGQGVPCLFVHGGPGAGSEIVQKLAGGAFEKSCRMIYLDQRGSGRSASDPHKDYSLERVVKDMEEVRERLKVRQWVLVSHSFGGIIATAYARRHPERVSAMVLVNSILNLPASMESTATHGYALLPAGKPPMDPAAPLPQRFGMVMAMLGQTGKMAELSFTNPATATRASAAMKGLEANNDFMRTIFTSPAIGTYTDDFTAGTSSMTMPVLIITGKEDHMVGVDQYKSFRFPNQRVAQVAGKHYAMIEQQEEVSRALAGFIATLPK